MERTLLQPCDSGTEIQPVMRLSFFRRAPLSLAPDVQGYFDASGEEQTGGIARLFQSRSVKTR